MKDVKFQLGAEVTFFKTKLVGMIDSESGKIVVRQPKAGVDAQGLSIQEFLDEITQNELFKNLEINPPEITLPDIVKKVTEDIRITLNEIFMLIETKEPKSVEFAIWVSMDATKLRETKLFPVAIDTAYIKVWNTDNEIICDEMDITLIKKLLESAPTEQLEAE